MFRKLVLSAVFAFSSLSVFADINMSTTIAPMGVRATCEQSGSIDFRVTSDDFYDVSEENPAYIRLRFDHGALLCQTLVHEPSGLAPIQVPAALELGSGNEGDTINIPAGAVSIVRWKQGEPELWLKITSSSSTWIRSGQDLVAPSPERPIRFSIGIDAATSQAMNEMLFQMGRANLAASLQNNAVVDTEMRFDLSKSNLEPLPAPMEESGLFFDPISFDNQTENVESAASFTQINLGQIYPVPFSDDRIIGRGFEDDVVNPPNPGAYGVELRTVIRDIAINNDNQRAGLINFNIDSDDFETASPQNPVYIRMRLDHGVTLADDRVVPGSDHQPIYLPLATEHGPHDYDVAAPATAVSIVRWVAGERSVWLKITAPTSTWLRNSQTGQLAAPNADAPVSFSIGLSAGRSISDNSDLFADGKANLPYATTKGARNLPADTKFNVDLTESNLEPLPAPQELSALNFDPIAFDSDTEGVEDQIDAADITLGQLEPVPFSDDRIIGRGFASGFSELIDLNGTARALNYDRNNQLLGVLRADIKGNAFAYLDGGSEFHLNLAEGFTLSKTLVAPGAAPIQVALKLRNGSEAGVEMVAAEDAVTIVRWVQGEDQITLKVNQTSDTWLKRGNELLAPSEENQVRLVLGNSAAASVRSFLRKYNQGLANLPANMKVNQGSGQSQAADTRTRVDIDRAEVGVGSTATFALDYSGEIAKVGQVKVK